MNRTFEKALKTKLRSARKVEVLKDRNSRITFELDDGMRIIFDISGWDLWLSIYTPGQQPLSEEILGRDGVKPTYGYVEFKPGFLLTGFLMKWLGAHRHPDKITMAQRAHHYIVSGRVLPLLTILWLGLNITPAACSVAPAGIHRLASIYASKSGLSTSLVLAVIDAESSFRPRLVGTSGEVGLMQIMPQTAHDLGVPYKRFSRTMASPTENIRVGTEYLAKLVDMYGGDTERALAHYNGGGYNAITYPKCKPAVKQYVWRVIGLQDSYQRALREQEQYAK